MTDSKGTGDETRARSESASAASGSLPEDVSACLVEAAVRSNDAVLVLDAGGTILWSNEAAERLTGYSRAELQGMSAAALRDALVDNSFSLALVEAITAGRSFRTLLTGRRKSGELCYADVSVTCLPGPSGAVTRLLAVARDLAQSRLMENEMRRLAYFDPLTGLASRSLFLDRLTQALGRAAAGDRLVAVVTLDVDGFRRINEAFGPTAGDDLLRAVGARLSGRLREGDTVGRLGSDEFGVLLVDMKRSASVPAVLDKILSTFDEPFSVAGQDLMLSACAGVSVAPEDGDEPLALLKQSGLALARARAEGPRSQRFFRREMDVHGGEFLSLAVRLRHAAERNEFVAHFQPYFDARRGSMAGMEALIRWQTPDLGIVPPSRFIPVLEETGLIVEAGYWMIGEVCRRLRAWRDAGRAVVPVAINLSPLQFRQRDLARTIARLAREADVPPDRLVFEITESTFMHDLAFTQATLEELKRLGVTIAIDDFGTGYSSLNYLKRFPVDLLKIDQSFVREVSTDLDDAALVSAIVSMAHNLGIRTIAEGVETDEQLRILRILRCDMVQGYLFARPIPAAEEARLFSGWAAGR